MDITTLSEILKETTKHVEIINGELGKCQVDIAWLKQSWWCLMDWMKMLTIGIFISVLGTAWNVYLTKKNGKR